MTGMELILSELNLNDSDAGSRLDINKYKLLNDLKELRADAEHILQGQKLKIATLNDYPLSFRICLNQTSCTWHGVVFEIVDFLAEKYNFTYNVIVPKKNIIGSSNDMAGSLLELLKNKTVDMAAAFVPLLADAREHIYYSTSTLDEGEWIMIMQRPPESASGSGLLAPFETYVWILILISLFVVGPIIYCLIILRNKLTGDKTQRPYALTHCFWFVYGALMKQGSTLSPVADSTRLLFATWWLFITVLTSFYTANLTAFLTLSKFTLPINNVDDLYKNEQRFVSHRGSAVEYSITNPNEDLFFLNGMVRKNRSVFIESVNDTETLISFVEKSKFVFIRDRPAIDHLIYKDYKYRKTINKEDEKVHCPFAISKIPFMRKRRAFAYPLNNVLLSRLFDAELLNLVESGIVKYLISQRLPGAEICPQDLGGTERQLRNTDLMMTYYIMLAGFATSSVIFTTEIVFRFLNEKRGRSTPVNRFGNIRSDHRLLNQGVHTITPPPPYGSLFKRTRNIVVATDGFNDSTGTKKSINGRDYMVFIGSNGEKKLIPMRAPSATLFQYAYTE